MSKSMQIEEQEARVIVELAEQCYDEGLGADGDKELLKRIAAEFGVELIPPHMRPMVAAVRAADA